MKVLVENFNRSLRFCLTLLNLSSFLIADEYNSNMQMLHNVFWFFWMMFAVGINTITQTGDLIQVWGDLPMMTSTAFLLLTDVALLVKIINVMLRRRAILAIIRGTDLELKTEQRMEGKRIIDECDRETTRHLCLFMGLTGITVLSWASGAEKNKLPLRAWYPYNTSRSPAYELTYLQQSLSVIIAGILNVSLDTLVTSSIAVCRCRLRLLALSITQLCQGVYIPRKNRMMSNANEIINKRLRGCVLKHQAALEAASQIQSCFSEPILTQFTVSSIIICVTAYQLAVEVHQSNLIRMVAMITYLLGMILQVFLYCHQGHQLAEESSNIADAAYECPWYNLPIPLRRGLLLVMVRSRRVAQLTAGGLATLSLSCFTSIIKASYSFFTVLQQVEE